MPLLTATSKAEFKIGIQQTDERLNDFILKTKLKDFYLFKRELVRYLNILKKI